jgi:MFS family permease
MARIAQLVWTVLAVGGTVAIVVRVVTHWTTSEAICRAESSCSGSQLDAASARTLGRYGVSLSTFAVYHHIIFPAVLGMFFVLSALIMLRKSNDRGAVLAAFFLITFPLAIATSVVAALAALTLFGLLFPTGRFAPRWTRWLALAVIISCIAAIIAPWPAPLVVVALIVPVPFLQIYRFRSLASWAQRQQVKWALFGLAATIVGLVALLISEIVAPWDSGNGSLYNSLTSVTLVPLFLSAIPISLAISVLRSNLWDIDKVISRALAYTTLSLTLGGLYIGGVIGFQRLFQVFAGGGSPVAIALSTLVIAALFGPLRHRIQAIIDRRFYRAKYDGVRAVTAFAQRLRGELDLAQLSQDMTTVVRETLQPEHVSLWLRDGNRAAVPSEAPSRQATVRYTP